MCGPKPSPARTSTTPRCASTNGHYWNSSNDNFTDYSLIGNGDLVFDGRTGLKLRAEFRHGHDPRGSTDRAVTLDAGRVQQLRPRRRVPLRRAGGAGPHRNRRRRLRAPLYQQPRHHRCLQPQYLAGWRHLLLARHAAHRGAHPGPAHQHPLHGRLLARANAVLGREPLLPGPEVGGHRQDHRHDQVRLHDEEFRFLGAQGLLGQQLGSRRALEPAHLLGVRPRPPRG